MQFAVSDIALPVRLRFERPLTDEELLHFCAANEALRVERDRNGELIVMTPVGTEGGGIELDVAAELRDWARGWPRASVWFERRCSLAGRFCAGG